MRPFRACPPIRIMSPSPFMPSRASTINRSREQPPWCRPCTTCATTMIATARLSTRSVAPPVRAWRAAGILFPPGHDSLPPHAVTMSPAKVTGTPHGHGTPRRMCTRRDGASRRRVAPCPYGRVYRASWMTAGALPGNRQPASGNLKLIGGEFELAGGKVLPQTGRAAHARQEAPISPSEQRQDGHGVRYAAPSSSASSSSLMARRCGKSSTSRMVLLLAKIMVMRSTPMPKPPAGGMP